MTKSSHHSHAMLVRQALWALQKEVLNSLKEQFDSEVGYEAQPNEWFNVLLTAERYKWLRELTSLMADIDIMTELEMISEEHGETARAEIERLLFEENPEPDSFTKQYRNLLLSGVSLMPLHSQLKASLQNLPKSEKAKEHHHTQRKTWHEEHRSQARKKRN
ncbi:hypothetical protein [Bdellovibrio sp. KM01]|uniref:hypothetical protein n=1 Tax=Bdellovibrio sp. KM01 TaxID=2748865 RepID=UPI0015E96C3E|nr:hypothetical protein [Bdellovibrio sp. KM01]QLY26307.1 hypothetical protein HW988_04560 [Bdellovibrio sp. KM01]